MQLYRYRWNRCGRKDQRCIVTARGKMNSCRVEFEDGHVMITSRNAIAKIKGEYDARLHVEQQQRQLDRDSVP